MEFLKEILGEELFDQFKTVVDAYNGNEANKEKQIKLENINTGEYVSKLKYEDLNGQLTGKNTELEQANGLIAELKNATKDNEEIQGKFTNYETQVANLQKQLADTEIEYAFNLLLIDSGVKEADAREYLTFKYKKKLVEDGKTLEIDENKHIKGGDAIIESLKITNPSSFETISGSERIIEPNKLPNSDNKKTYTKEEFKAMTYEQRLALKNEDEQLYKQLKK